MYRRTKQYIKTNNADPNIFIDKNDYSNSELLYRLDNVVEYEIYTITKYEHRIDLISMDIYSDVKYAWLLQYINRVKIDELVRGKQIKYIPLTTLKSIINAI